MDEISSLKGAKAQLQTFSMATFDLSDPNRVVPALFTGLIEHCHQAEAK